MSDFKILHLVLAYPYNERIAYSEQNSAYTIDMNLSSKPHTLSINGTSLHLNGRDKFDLVSMIDCFAGPNCFYHLNKDISLILNHYLTNNTRLVDWSQDVVSKICDLRLYYQYKCVAEMCNN